MNRRLPMYMIAAILIMAVSVRLVGAEDLCVVPTVTEEITIPADWPDWTEWYGKLQIDAEKSTIDRGEGIHLWCFAEWGSTCPPFNWNVSGNGFHFYGVAGPTTGRTDEEFEIIPLYADATACGSATITVTDSQGEFSHAYVLCQQGGHWVQLYNHRCWLGECGDCLYPGPADLTVKYLNTPPRWYSDKYVGKYRYRQYTDWACGSEVYPCGHSYWDTHCLPTHSDQIEPCITDDEEFFVPCVNSGAGSSHYHKNYIQLFEWKCNQ